MRDGCRQFTEYSDPRNMTELRYCGRALPDAGSEKQQKGAHELQKELRLHHIDFASGIAHERTQTMACAPDDGADYEHKKRAGTQSTEAKRRPYQERNGQV